MTKPSTSRNQVIEKEILNSSDKRMRNGQDPGPIKSKVEIRRGAAKNKVKSTPEPDNKKKSS